MLMMDPQREALRYRELIDARWLQAVELPSARAFSRGYDRMTVDVLVADCAETIDELTWQVQAAHQEAAELRRQARARVARRGRVRKSGRRPARWATRRRVLPTR